MRDYLTVDDICNQISMNRSLFKGTILLSEGNTDQRLYGKFIDRKGTKILPAHSKSNVIQVVNKMTARRDGKVLGIVDKDLDELKGRVYSPPVFYTDMRDLEMMLINSDALDDVLSEYGDQDRMQRFERQFGNIREAIIEASYPLGLLMYVSHLRGYNLNFKNLDFRDFIDRKTLKVDLTRMVQSVIENTYGSELSRKNVLRDLQSQMSNHTDKHMIARGHDAVNVLMIGLKDAFGSYNSSNLNEGSLGGALRLAFDDDEFESTDLFKNTSEWASERNIKLWKINRIPDPLP
jgi:hypothetical protein